MVLKAKAYAKVNLFLDVAGKRQDGYHELDTVMQSVSLYDLVSVSFEKGSEGITTIYSDGFSEENDLVSRLCAAFCQIAGLECRIEVHVTKNIPAAAGLAGLSADAAAAIMLINRYIGDRYSVLELAEFASGFGADIPFCLLGGTCRAGGIGEKLSKHNSPKLHFVLLKNGVKESTGKMFAALDSVGSTPRGSAEALISGLETGNLELVCQNLYNAFENCWDMRSLCAPFSDYEPLNIFLSGSGPTVVALFETGERAEHCADMLFSAGYAAFYAHTVDNGVEFV